MATIVIMIFSLICIRVCSSLYVANRFTALIHMNRLKVPKLSKCLLSTSDDSRISENLMSIDELKAELDLREVDYKDCFSKSELVNRLIESRVSGKANPDILKQFNSSLQVSHLSCFLAKFSSQ